MATQPNNPFVLPGFGQPGELGQNPLLASMEMMRQTWQNLAGLGGFDTSSMVSAALSPEDLERRISDLRAVENWLRMNLSMLSSTIQGMEVQRATVSTLRTFVQSAQAAGNTPDGVSPLDAVLGIRRGAAGAESPFGTKQQASGAAQGTAYAGAKASPDAGSDAAQGAPEPSSSATASAGQAKEASENVAAGATAAAQGWWTMLQQQFDNLAAATSASLQGAEALKAGMASAAAAASAAPGKPAGKTAARKSAAKSAPRKTAARKTASKAANKAAAPSGRKTSARTGRAPKA